MINTFSAVRIDQYIDYIPVLGTAGNLCHLFFKHVVAPMTKEVKSLENYRLYVENKEFFYGALLIPVLGTLVTFYLTYLKEIKIEQIQTMFDLGNVNQERLFLAAKKTPLSKYDLELVLKKAVEADRLDIVKALLNDGRTIDKCYLAGPVRAAIRVGRLDIVEFLLGNGRTISEADLGWVVKAAVEANRLDIVEFLLGNGRTIDRWYLGKAVRAAVKANRLDIVEFLLGNGRTISEEDLGWAVSAAVQVGRLYIVEFLLSNGRTISEEDLRWAVRDAVRADHVDILEFLLGNGRRISEEHLGGAVIIASSRGHCDIVEILLRRGAIGGHARDSAITQASGALREQIISILRAARISSARINLQRQSGDFWVSIEDLKNNPLLYLNQICEEGLPSCVHFLENPDAVDLGGVTKQFIVTLVAALIEKKCIIVSEHKIPTIQEDSQINVWRNLGKFFSCIYERNVWRTDKYLTGIVFAPEFFKVIRGRENSITIAQLLYKAADLEFFLETVPNTTQKKFTSEDAEGVIDQYGKAANAFYEGAFGKFKRKIDAIDLIDPEDANRLSISIQGQEASGEVVSGMLTISPEAIGSDVLSNKIRWIQSWLKTTEQENVRCFLKAITGRSVISDSSTIISIKETWRESNCFEFHTCINSIDVLRGEVEEELFIQGLKSALSGEGYNIA